MKLLSFCTILAGAVAAFLSAHAAAQSLSISVEGRRNGEGVVQYNICQVDEYEQSITNMVACRVTGSVPATKGVVRFRLPLAAGAYAVIILHDEDENGTTGRSGLLPTEGVGFSRNPRLIFGVPSFEQVAVQVKGNAAISLKAKYFQ